jgi:hypothetical protein
LNESTTSGLDRAIPAQAGLAYTHNQPILHVNLKEWAILAYLRDNFKSFE